MRSSGSNAPRTVSQHTDQYVFTLLDTLFDQRALQFEAAANELGINNDDTLVVYDRLGLFSAPRVWWTWHVFGHDK